MEIDIVLEEPDELLTFSQAGRETPGRPHVATFHRWDKRGLKGVKLATVLVGGRRYVSRAALRDFFAEVTAIANGEAPPVSAPKGRQKVINRAEAELATAGIGDATPTGDVSDQPH